MKIPLYRGGKHQNFGRQFIFGSYTVHVTVHTVSIQGVCAAFSMNWKGGHS